MPLTSSRTRSLVNALTLASAVALAGLLGLRGLGFMLPRASYRLDRPGVRAPRTMLDWKAHPHTLLVALGPDCAECRAHAPFLRRLVSEPRAGVSVVAVAEPPAAQAAQTLAGLGIESAPRLLLFRFAGVQLQQVPSVILVDAGGTVKGVWQGDVDEAAVLAALH